ncbi:MULTISPECIES: hypothetical protein [Hwangdonia]|uniref:Uncharacterized protein n=1 Tax=Hwangdonia seohaensis TaxID=1240727 RepID=A0ABW3RCY9_9FLAO|nr:hypothetical protein [Hwangdonia seohaensis]
MNSLFKKYSHRLNTLCLIVISTTTMLVSCSKDEICDTPATLTLKNNESLYPRHVYFIEDESDIYDINENDLPPNYIIPSKQSQIIILTPGKYKLYSFVYERGRCSRCQDKIHNETISELEISNCEENVTTFPDLDLGRN